MKFSMYLNRRVFVMPDYVYPCIPLFLHCIVDGHVEGWGMGHMVYYIDLTMSQDIVARLVWVECWLSLPPAIRFQ